MKVADRSSSQSLCLALLLYLMFSQPLLAVSVPSRQILLNVVEQAFKLGYDIYAGAEFSFSVLAQDVLPTAVFTKLQTDLEREGVLIVTSDRVGQYVVTVPLRRVCDLSDTLVKCKELIRSFSARECPVTFMPLVCAGHTHGLKMAWCLYDVLEQKNMCTLLGSSENPELPLRAQQALAGIVSVFRDMSIVLNPTINSYKRLRCCITGVPGVTWSYRESSAALHVVQNWAHSGQSAFVITTADMGADPYLAYAAISRAALEGIQYRMEAPQACDGSCVLESKIHQLPVSLAQAIQIAETSDFLRDWLGEALEAYLAEKRKEVAEFESTVTDWEMRRYG